MSPPPDKPHSLADHALGALAAHGHGEGEFDHDHDDDFLDGESKALESVDFISMGIDIGSSSTQVVFTRLRLRGPGEPRALRGREKSREILHMSPIVVTPFRDDGSIDETRLRGTLASAFRAANLTPDDVETGAVILTGEAARRENAESIAHLVAADVGELVCAVAGDRMEAMLAARGSGAVEASRQGGMGRRVLNIDIGGATTKLALVDDGRVTETSALSIGGRLLVVDRADRVTRLDAAGALHARRAGIVLEKGSTARPADVARIAEGMADALVAALTEPETVAELFILPPLADLAGVDGIMLSGGVAEYVYGRESRDFGDLGHRLGRAIRARLDATALPWPLLPAGECIRATALGASAHTMQLSGQTLYISNHAALLPRRNLPVLRPPADFGETIDPAGIAEGISGHRRLFGLESPLTPMALAFRWSGPPDYARLRGLAEGIAAGMADVVSTGAPLFVMLEGDAALGLGGVLRDELRVPSEVLVVDGVTLRDFDYVDIGRLRLPSGTVPVTIKSLLFGS